MRGFKAPPVVDHQAWQRELDALRFREKAATRELDAIAALRRRLPMIAMDDYVLEGERGPVRIVTQGPIDEAIAYKRRVGNQMAWYSTANSPFGTDVGVPPGGQFAVNVFLRQDDSVYRTWFTNRRGVEQLSHVFSLIDVLPYGRQEQWQDSPDGWPQGPTYSRWASSPEIAQLYGSNS